MSKHKEFIVAIHQDAMAGYFTTVPTTVTGVYEQCGNVEIDPSKVIIAQRGWLEEDTDYRQFISYVLIVNEKDQVLLYQRTKTSGEKKLCLKHSVGWGGHVDAPDACYDDDLVLNVNATLNVSTKRELSEELGIVPGSYTPISGTSIWIVANTNPVDKVHVAFSTALRVDSSFTVSSDEDRQDLIGFVSVDEALRYDLEEWSVLALKHLKEVL